MFSKSAPPPGSNLKYGKRTSQGKSYVRHAAMIEGVDIFDNDQFGIVDAEARRMAPEQRHLLDLGLRAFVGAAWEGAVLVGSSTGCFIG